jgi:hypothetical protein
VCVCVCVCVRERVFVYIIALPFIKQTGGGGLECVQTSSFRNVFFIRADEAKCTTSVSSQKMHIRITSAHSPGVKNYFFLVGFLCGVEGRPEFIPLY